jgi:hypothetical protein
MTLQRGTVLFASCPPNVEAAKEYVRRMGFGQDKVAILNITHPDGEVQTIVRAKTEIIT